MVSNLEEYTKHTKSTCEIWWKCQILKSFSDLEESNISNNNTNNNNNSDNNRDSNSSSSTYSQEDDDLSLDDDLSTF